ncbi:hypothetical protein Avbf_05438 [Armadillidium vulgare]|nr:hypothetical protein Avbf_05438 [Armadillidium vulgare]
MKMKEDVKRLTMMSMNLKESKVFFKWEEEDLVFLEEDAPTECGEFAEFTGGTDAIGDIADITSYVLKETMVSAWL